MSNVNNQMSNVNEVKLLSERTSGVPPVIFVRVACSHVPFYIFLSSSADNLTCWFAFLIVITHSGVEFDLETL